MMDGATQKPVDDSTKKNSGESERSLEEQTVERKQKPSVADYLHKVNSNIKQKQLKRGLDICNEALSVHSGNSRLLEKKSKVLCQLHRFQEAFDLVEEWIKLEPQNSTAKQKLEKLKIILSTIDSDEEEGHLQGSDISKEDDQFDEKVTSGDKQRKNAAKTDGDSTAFASQDRIAVFTCTTCDISFTQKAELDRHIYLHEWKLVGDGTYDWHYRVCPRGLSGDEYGLCKRFMETESCPFGKMCTRAHSEAELEEWNHWYNVHKQQTQESRVHASAYIEQLMEKLMSQEPTKILVENLDHVKILVNADLKVRTQTKKCTLAWTFTITSKLCLHCVALMSETYRSYFHISSLSVGPRKTQKYQNLENHCQEWVNPDARNKSPREHVYRVKVVFKTNIYGTFRQAVVFDFGVDALVVRELEVSSPLDPEKIIKEVTLTQTQKWNKKTSATAKFEPRPESYSEPEVALITKYSLPQPDKFCQSETVIHKLSKSNYRLWMHEMLYIEEMARNDVISRFSVTTTLRLMDSVKSAESTVSAARCVESGELFACLELKDDLSVDSVAGHLVLQSSSVAWLGDGRKEHPDKVYEAVIEGKDRNFLIMRLSKICVDELGLSCSQGFLARIRFQLDRLSMCEMHSAVDQLPTLDIVFPDLENAPDKIDLEDDVLQDLLDEKQLNGKQEEAVKLIVGGRELKLPPVLILGPSGTGKTFTLIQAAKQILKLEGSRILICTASDSAADLYTTQLLHSCVEAHPLRVMSKFRLIQTVADAVLEHSLLGGEHQEAGTFRTPTVEDVMEHRVIITTLSCARYLVDLELPKETFSHIFVDEAGQALESEAIVPLSLAHGSTRIVLAGDYMQINPEVYSDFSRQQGFHVSLLERLHEFYPKECSYRMVMCEIYNTHAAIVELVSDLFYDNKLVSNGTSSAHEQFYPLTFYAVKGEEIQRGDISGFYNLSEVSEVGDRVGELIKKWPDVWGSCDQNGIVIVVPYSDQVSEIMAELRKRKLLNVDVERASNMQNKRYRVVIVSVTRTRLTCRSDSGMEDYMNYGFLSDLKLLSAALNRAQSLVVVVGDPVSMCLVGKCRKIWEHFLAVCDYNKSLHGISWESLKEQLNQAELAKSWTLNPHAPEFVPNQPYSLHAQQQDHGYVYVGQSGAWPGQRLFPGRPLPQMLSPGYHWPMFYPLNPGMMYQAPFLNRGIRYNKQMLSRFVSPGGGLHYSRGAGPMKESKPHIVEMPGSGVTRSSWKRGRFEYYTPQMHVLPPAPYGYTSLLHPHQVTGGYFYPMKDPRNLPLASVQASYHPYMIPPHQHPGIIHHPSEGFAPAYMYRPSHDNQPLQSVSGHVAYEEMDAAGDRSDTPDSNESLRFTESPNSKFQLLPNVKHIPTYLQGRPADISPEASGSHAESSSVSTSCGSQILLGDERIAALSSRPYSPANYGNERNGLDDVPQERSFSPADATKEHVVSGDVGLSRSYTPTNSCILEEDTQNSHEKPPTPSQARSDDSSKVSLVDGQTDHELGCNNFDGTAKLNSSRKTPNLTLRTGFSRQFSDGLPTPAVITNMIQMIDENIEEDFAEDGSPLSVRKEHKSCLKLKMTNTERLQLQQQVTGSSSVSSSSTSPSEEDFHLSHAGIVDQTDLNQGSTADLVAQLEIQTPRTPKGFMTPGTEGQVDPFGILKSLHIGEGPF